MERGFVITVLLVLAAAFIVGSFNPTSSSVSGAAIQPSYFPSNGRMEPQQEPEFCECKVGDLSSASEQKLCPDGVHYMEVTHWAYCQRDVSCTRVWISSNNNETGMWWNGKWGQKHSAITKPCPKE